MKRILFYADTLNGTSAYSRVVKNLATRLAKDKNYDVYVQEIATTDPANIYEGVRTLPVFAPRGEPLFVKCLVNNLRIFNPNVFIPICDPFLLQRDGINKITFNNIKLMTYMPLDGIGVPDNSEEIIEKSSKVITMSEYAKEQFKEENIDANVLYHGVDFNKFKPVDKTVQNTLKKSFGFKEDDFVFLTVGRNFLRKRQNRLIESIALFNKDNPDNKAKFYFHCSDSEMENFNLVKFVSRMAKRYDVKMDNIIFSETHGLGRGVSDDRIVEMFQMCDCFISATSGEGFGMPTTEAMACKKLVVLPSNTTATEFLGDNERGLIVGNDGFMNVGYGIQQEVVDINKLKGVIELACFLPDSEVEIITDKAYNWVKQNCDWDLITEQLKQYINEVC